MGNQNAYEGPEEANDGMLKHAHSSNMMDNYYIRQNLINQSS